MKIAILKTLCIIFCLSLALSFLASAETADRDKFIDSNWGVWSRIFPEGNFSEKDREPILPKIVDGGMEFSIHSIYATGFVSDQKISPHNAKATLSIQELPKTNKDEIMFDGVNNFNCFFMIGLSDDSLKKNSRDWIFRSTGVYVMVTPINENETRFSMTYNYDGSRADEIEREERSIDNLLQFEGITLPIAFKDTFEVEFTKDDILIKHNGTSYSFANKANNDTSVFDRYYHQKAYKALEGEAYKCFAIYNSLPQFKPSTMLIKEFSGQQPQSEDGVVYDATKPEKNSGTTSKSLADADDIGPDYTYLIIISAAAIVLTGFAVTVVIARKSNKKVD